MTSLCIVDSTGNHTCAFKACWIFNNRNKPPGNTIIMNLCHYTISQISFLEISFATSFIVVPKKFRRFVAQLDMNKSVFLGPPDKIRERQDRDPRPLGRRQHFISLRLRQRVYTTSLPAELEGTRPAPTIFSNSLRCLGLA